MHGDRHLAELLRHLLGNPLLVRADGMKASKDPLHHERIIAGVLEPILVSAFVFNLSKIWMASVKQFTDTQLALLHILIGSNLMISSP